MTGVLLLSLDTTGQLFACIVFMRSAIPDTKAVVPKEDPIAAEALCEIGGLLAIAYQRLSAIRFFYGADKTGCPRRILLLRSLSRRLSSLKPPTESTALARCAGAIGQASPFLWDDKTDQHGM
jgi:hypothetical protein